MPTTELSLSEARAVMIAAQGLDHRSRPVPKKKRDVLQAIRRMCALQIDTINVVARSPYVVLWTRLGDYQPRWLDELLTEGLLFEYWSHEACFLPIEDYPLYRQRMLDPHSLGWRYSHEWIRTNRKVVDQVLAQIREQGPVRSSDFVRTDGKAGGWWEWKPEKQALEMLFTAGELMIARRHNFQRIYDLRDRVLPSRDDSHIPSKEEAQRMMALRAVRALGVAKSSWVSDYFRTNKRETSALMGKLVSEGSLLGVRVAGWEQEVYIHIDNRPLLDRATSRRAGQEFTTLLSPFDPLVWDRKRTLEMFGFDYRLECYTPEAKRRYGYFNLPILQGDKLIGRLDPKAHRKEGVFEVKSLHLEPRVLLSDELVAGIACALKEFAGWQKIFEVIIKLTSPSKLAPRLRRALR